MSHPAAFTNHVARLVWLLAFRPKATEEHKQALRAAIVEGQTRGHVIVRSDLTLAIADAAALPVPPAGLQWLSELAARMAGHAVTDLAFSAGVKPADLLGVARILASAPVAGDEGVNFDARAVDLQLTTISVRLGRGGFVRRPTPIATTRVRLSTPAAAHMPAPMPGTAPGAPAPSAASILASAPAEGSAPTMPTDASQMPDLDKGSDQRQIAAAAFAPRGSGDALARACEQLEGVLSAESAPRVLDALLRASEDLSTRGAWDDVARILERVIAREATLTDPDVKRGFGIYLRRAMRPGTLRGLAQLLGRRRELRPALESIFVRAGEEGAEALIAQMIASNAASERRAYRTALARCPAAAGPLMHLLDDTRWFVVRNAVELLDELGVREAEEKLMLALGHGDARVRKSAAAALSRLGSARGIGALLPLLRDPNAAVRLQAVHALSAARNARSVPALLQAQEREEDPEIQHALVMALGAHPTDAAVERLVQLAQPGTFLSRRAVPRRVAAVTALGEAATHAALAALRQLQRDRERSVRDAVERALEGRAQGAFAGR